MHRRLFLKNASLAGGLAYLSTFAGKGNFPHDSDFPVVDLHVHLTEKFTIDHLMDIAAKRNVLFGIVEHPASRAIQTDADLIKYIDQLRKYPVYIGLQPNSFGWARNFSPELLSQIDYILMDAQIFPDANGEMMYIWQFDTYVEDTEDFMERYMKHTLNILQNESIHIFGWPLFLPVCIARDYYSLWTEERMQSIITAAKIKNIAIEINDMSHTPHAKFILMAKEQGLKFTFGSDSRNQNAGRLSYCRDIAKKCKLTSDDFYLPKRMPGK